MYSELYRVLKEIISENLNNEDKEEPLKIFLSTKNTLIRNQIAFIFADLHYEKSVPL